MGLVTSSFSSERYATAMSSPVPARDMSCRHVRTATLAPSRAAQHSAVARTQADGEIFTLPSST